MERGKIAIAGAGLCGTMMAIRLAEYGYEVDLYERRPDLRKTDISAGRSINLALSNRGLKALDMIGLKEKVIAEIIPMHGRLIHPSEGENTMYSYSGRENEYMIEKHALHIWPRKGHMMIALPNMDGSFTLTMFTPFEGPVGMDRLVTDELITEFMEQNFADATVHIPDLLEQFHTNPAASLGTIKCYPWTYNRTVLLGDSAHAIVPFYGQGMNCALEDCVVLDQLIQDHDHDWDKILPAYQKQRKVDADAIADLAEDNFYEMRDGTADPVFNDKRIIELRLEAEHDYYSKYSLVTFRADVPYHIAMKQGRLQNKVLYDIAKEVDDPNTVSLEPILKVVNTFVEERM